MSLVELARLAGVSKTTLFHVEAGNANPSLDTLWSIATALEVPFAALIEDVLPESRLIRATEGASAVNDADTYAATLLSSSRVSTRRDVYRVDAVGGEPRHSQPHMPGTIEHLIVVNGTVEAGHTQNPETLHPGDYLSYPGDQPHLFAALHGPARAILISETRDS